VGSSSSSSCVASAGRGKATDLAWVCMMKLP
jgi:hypothetical protein